LFYDFLFLGGKSLMAPSFHEKDFIRSLVVEDGDQIDNRRLLPAGERRGVLAPDGAIGALVRLELCP
jgi:hypothetical protein